MHLLLWCNPSCFFHLCMFGPLHCHPISISLTLSCRIFLIKYIKFNDRLQKISFFQSNILDFLCCCLFHGLRGLLLQYFHQCVLHSSRFTPSISTGMSWNGVISSFISILSYSLLTYSTLSSFLLKNLRLGWALSHLANFETLLIFSCQIDNLSHCHCVSILPISTTKDLSDPSRYPVGSIAVAAWVGSCIEFIGLGSSCTWW